MARVLFDPYTGQKCPFLELCARLTESKSAVEADTRQSAFKII